MLTPNWFNITSLPVVFILSIIIFIGAIEIGTWLGRWSTNEKKTAHQGSVGTLVGSLLGLLAFFLAFTFSMTASRFDQRKHLVLDEANAIRTVYHNAALAPVREGKEIQRLLREYTNLRLDLTRENVLERLEQSRVIHEHLRVQLKQLMTTNMDTDFRSSFIDDMKELFNLHQSRLTTGLQYQIPATIWLLLYFLSILSMTAIGYQAGFSGAGRLRAAPIVALAFSLVIVVIADIDRPGEGRFRVGTQPLKDTQQMMLRDVPQSN